MKPKFTILDWCACEASGTPCLISPRGQEALAKREINGVRCVRHHALLGSCGEAFYKAARDLSDERDIRKLWREVVRREQV